MLLIQCVNAYMATTYLMEKEWDYETAYTLAGLKRTLQPHVDFFVQEEQKLINEYGQKDEKGHVVFTERGTFLFETADGAAEYAAKRNQLGRVPVELEWKAKTLTKPERIKPVHLEALAGFIDFGGDA